jgi:preprotein translocase subunit YajC
LILFAETQSKQEGGGGMNTLLFLLPIILMLYLLIVVLPGRRRAEKERQELLGKMSKGDEVLTIAGIYGTVISVHETKDEVVVKVDDGTRLRMTKGSIARNMTAEENVKKAKEAAAQAKAAPASTAITEKK